MLDGKSCGGATPVVEQDEPEEMDGAELHKAP